MGEDAIKEHEKKGTSIEITLQKENIKPLDPSKIHNPKYDVHWEDIFWEWFSN